MAESLMRLSFLSRRPEFRREAIAALESFVSEEVRALPGVERTETILALASPKETPILPVAPAQDE
jgi:Lrp/AsnC family leucine-responsive transcriptional regulator